MKRSGVVKANNWTHRDQLYDQLSHFQAIKKFPDQSSMRHLYFDQYWHLANCPYYDVYPSIIPMLTKIKLDLSGEHMLDTFLSCDLRNHANTMMDQVNDQLVMSKGLVNWIDIDRRINLFFSKYATMPHLLIRLPDVEHPLKFVDDVAGEVSVKTIFMSFQPVNLKSIKDRKDQLTYGLTIGIDIGEDLELNGETQPGGMGLTYTLRPQKDVRLPTYLINCFPLNEQSLEDSINLLPAHSSAKEGIQVPLQTIKDCVRLCLTIRLIKDEPELIQPDVLAADRAKYDALAAGDTALGMRLVQKAIQRGKYGYRVGHLYENKETIPHVRRPHPALVWTGEGRKIPRIVLRRGSVVHRDKVSQIPSGYLDKQKSSEQE